MSAYLQLGHNSWNLLDEPDLDEYRGIVLSPVNDEPAAVQGRLAHLGGHRARHEVILDPQLYNPASDRGKLNTWPYFPSDLDTADRSNRRWWSNVIADVVRDAASLGLQAVCSPAEIPRVWTDEYFRFFADVADETYAVARQNGLETLMTVIVRLRDLANPRKALDIASIITASQCDRVYLIFAPEDQEERAPLLDADGLPTAVHLVRLLSQQMRVHVAFSGHDLVMWKFAGATDISTGKFLNLRRFCPSRWDEPEGGGRQISYWNESRLLTLLREQDVARLNRDGWFAGRTFPNNPAGQRIFQIITSGEERAWVQLAWLQFLRWASNTDRNMATPADAETYLVNADRSWGDLLARSPPILFADRFNNGDHVRIWLNAVREGGTR
jgi:hypothetical protein